MGTNTVALDRADPGRAIVFAGLLAGVLDITAALLVHGARGVRPWRLLQAIASGLMGPEAFKGGTSTAALGLLLHFFIALVAAGVYYAASRRLDVLVRRPVPAGMLYGIAVYLVMTHVVLPLSAVAKRPLALDMAAIMVVVHMLCVGLPIAWVVRRYAPPGADRLR